jgi:thiaminase/transcriptional activator TenA
VPHPLAQQLWNANQDLAAACLAHSFVQGIGDGSLPRERFQRYVAQDAFFLESFARAYALALAHSPDSHGLDAFAELLQGALDELKLHGSYAKKWRIDLTDVQASTATRNYTDFLLATAALEDVAATCAAMTPCMRLYAWLGQSLDKQYPDADHPYAEWITTYRDPGFDDLARTLEDLLDHYADDAPRIRQTYRRAMQLEVEFFAANGSLNP